MTVKTIENRHPYVEVGWNGAHCVAFFVLPQIMVRHLKIGQETTKLHPLIPMCHEFDSWAWQQSLGQHWQSMTP